METFLDAPANPVWLQWTGLAVGLVAALWPAGRFIYRKVVEPFLANVLASKAQNQILMYYNTVNTAKYYEKHRNEFVADYMALAIVFGAMICIDIMLLIVSVFSMLNDEPYLAYGSVAVVFVITVIVTYLLLKFFMNLAMFLMPSHVFSNIDRNIERWLKSHPLTEKDKDRASAVFDYIRKKARDKSEHDEN